MAEAGLSRKALARAVRERAARNGRPLSTDHTAVGRWLDGVLPRAATAEIVAEAIGQRVGRQVSCSDLGLLGNDLASTAEGLGLSLKTEADHPAHALVQLGA